jgi:bifunctional UDP-N-acetylglucosamine pyrophosphorylase/glucosamine-1-phosphate N-acetyltransferase
MLVFYRRGVASMKIRSVILAAGQGTRMRSQIPKVLHPLLGKPMLQYALDVVQGATQAMPVVVLGYGAETIRQAFAGKAEFVIQEPQLGTGHAVQQAEALLAGQADLVLVTYGDMPLFTTQTIDRIVQAQQTHAGPVTMLTMFAEDARGFGRIVRDEQGWVKTIVEEVQATPEQLAIHELNVGVYCFAAEWLWGALRKIPISPKGEYYLTDLIDIASSAGLSVQAQVLEDGREGIGINTRIHLAEAEAVLRERINRNWMLEGVTIVDPQRTYIEPDVEIGQDTVIWPDTYVQANSEIGRGCVLGPNTIIRKSQIGAHCKICASVVECARVEDEVEMGPYVHLRKGAHLGQGVHMGNFGEVKNSYLGPGTKMGHFSYIGDAQIGAGVNIGAGTITCNYDGEKKNKTEIGANAFIGSDTMLVAPVKMGEGAQTGAGAVVTKDVPPYTLAVGVPARPIRKLEKRE